MVSKTRRVLLTITIDTECDHDPNWIRSKPLRFESITEGLPNRLQPAFDAVSAVPTYLLTVEVMEDAASVQAINQMQGNFELGTHLHADFIEPEKKYQDYAGIDSPTFQCSYAPEIERQKLANLSNLFEDCFGYKPTSFRAGRYGANAHSLNSLQSLGYKVDTSVTPHIKWQEPPTVVDFRRAPKQPYFPASDEIIIAGPYSENRILEAPITVKPRLLRRTPQWFRPWFSSVSQMKDIVLYHLKKYSEKEVININMMFHSMEIIEKASPYPQTADDVRRFLDEMQEGLAWAGTEGCEFCSASSLYEPFKQAA